MSVKLSKQEQLALLHAMPPEQKKKLVKMVESELENQSGEGWWDSIKSFGMKALPILKEVAGPIATFVGPIILKEFLLPMLKAKFGGGLKLSGQGKKKKGSGLGLAGNGGYKRHMVKGSQEAKDYMAKLRAMRKKK